MGKVVTFGEIMLRLAPHGHYRFFQNDQMQATFGGAEANVAVSLANFGESVTYVTKVPSHAIGQGAIDTLRCLDVDTSFVVRGGSRLGAYYLERGTNQRPSVCIYDRAGSSISQAERHEFDWGAIFEGADWFHFSGITPALGDGPRAICRDACLEAERRGLTVSCDLNYRTKLWSREAAREVMSELCEHVDVCFANEEDAKNVFGIEAASTDVDAGRVNKAGYEDVARELLGRFGFTHVAFTLRTSHSATINDWAGALFGDGEAHYSKEYRIDNIVDRVGSGDAFAAGVIFGMRNGYGLQGTVEFAVAASALKHSIEGDFNRVSVAEAERLAGGSASGRVRR